MPGVAVLGRQGGELDAVAHTLPVAWKARIEEAADIGEKRRLAGAGRPHHGEHLAGRDACVTVSSGLPAERDRHRSRRSPLSVIGSLAASRRAARGAAGISGLGGRGNREAGGRQRHLQEGEDADDAPVAARCQRHGLGGHRFDAGRRRSSSVGRYEPDRHGEADRGRGGSAPASIGRRTCSQRRRAGPCRALRRPPRSGDRGSPRVRQATGTHRAARKRDARGPAPAGRSRCRRPGTAAAGRTGTRPAARSAAGRSGPAPLRRPCGVRSPSS